MVKSKTNKFKAVFIAALLFSVLASALAPMFIKGDDAQGRLHWFRGSNIERSFSADDPIPPDREPEGGRLGPNPDDSHPQVPTAPSTPAPQK